MRPARSRSARSRARSRSSSSSAYESIEITAPTRARQAGQPRRALALTAAPTEDAVVVDPEALEFGVTEMVPTIRKPRWTPEIGSVPVASEGRVRPGRRRVRHQAPLTVAKGSNGRARRTSVAHPHAVRKTRTSGADAHA